ncbi:maleylpyruvate isomerase family mycothiol-dependent enzyme [Streptomyces narbonensis]|uniref:maleylpyruvate isomerase family mycothiol-dependent enzyme n=1 Tax=Streptomyces narbonensis TaxID=67333 RepID=UPI001672F4F6|nr:maleylpyruvate isomerase family mycothiol-dependent enzyme [Streptomyces narbonensis]
MGITKHIEALETAGRALAEAAGGAGPDAEVPTCPGWRVRDLLRHTTTVHRWATTLVVEGRTSYHPGDGEPALDGDELLAYYQEGHAALVTALRAAPETLECWTFLPAPSPLAFWARRQAHETIVHRADAESALGSGPGAVDPATAADGIDELLCGLHGREKSRVRTPEERVLRVRTTDTGDLWNVRLSAAEPPRAERGTPATAGEWGPADAEFTGPADRLYLALWNRLPADAVTVTGEEALARLWRENSAVV